MKNIFYILRLHLRGKESGTGNVIFEGEVKENKTSIGLLESGTRMMWLPDYAAFRAGTQDLLNSFGSNIGIGSLAFGINNRAVGTNAASWGELNSAIRKNSTAWGRATRADGENATSWGYETTSLGISATAFGYETRAEEFGATAWGSATEAKGILSTAWGAMTRANNTYATAAGARSIASGRGATAIGHYLTAPSFFETVFGSYNTAYNPAGVEAWQPTDRLFVIGNGPNEQNRSNALTLLKNGRLGLGNDSPQRLLTLADPGLGFDRPAANALAVFTNNEERMRFHANGNVSIGSTGSTDRLVLESEAEQNALRVSVGGTTRLRVYGTGGVGIGSNMQSSLPPAGYLAVNQGVAIGTTDPADYQLRLSQNSAAKPTSNTWTIFSDARLKKNIQPIESSLQRLLSLRGVTYQWRDPATQGNMTGTYTGLIAQEVEKVFPEWISENSEGIKQLTVIGFEGIVVEALRELREEKDKEIKSLKDKIEKLETLLLQLVNNSNDGK